MTAIGQGHDSVREMQFSTRQPDWTKTTKSSKEPETSITADQPSTRVFDESSAVTGRHDCPNAAARQHALAVRQQGRPAQGWRMTRKRAARLVHMFLQLDNTISDWPDSNTMVQRAIAVCPMIDWLTDRFKVEINGVELPVFDKSAGNLLTAVERGITAFDWQGPVSNG